MKHILHVYKKSYHNPEHHYLGATKDIMARKEYFKYRNISTVDILVKEKTRYGHALETSVKINWSRCDAVILEMTFSPKAIHLIRNKAPQAKVLVRSHNAELLHRLNWAYTQGLSKKGLRYFAQAGKYFLCDLKCGSNADAILSIDEWESKKYWPHLSKKDNVKYLPFYLTKSYENQLVSNNIKHNYCVNFTSSSMNPIIRDSTLNFVDLIKRIDGKSKDWKFFITGDSKKLNLKLPNHVVATGWLDTPYSILKKAKAITLLSDYGYGFKTKILEAIVSKVYVIMTSGLYNRVPLDIKPYCIPVDIKSPETFLHAIEKSKEPFPSGNPNILRRQTAYKVLDKIIFSDR
jgi:hypothetical protein